MCATDISDQGLQFIGRFEGYRRFPYNDPAVPPNATIGYGHLLHMGPVTLRDRARYPLGLTQAQALTLLRKDATTAVQAIRSHVKVNLSQPQFDALASFTFNIGSGAFAGSSLLTKLNQGDYASVPAQLALWVHAGARVSPGLIYRRRAEADLFQHGDYSWKP